MVEWMIKHPMWRKRKLMKEKGALSDLLWKAAEHGSVDVMKCLRRLRAVNDYGKALAQAVAKNDMNCVKWLLKVFPGKEHISDYAILDEADRRGNLGMLQYFQSLPSVPGFKPKTPRSRQVKRGQTTVWNSIGTRMYTDRGDRFRKIKPGRGWERTDWDSTDAMDDAAANGHLEVVKWLHSNRSEGCTSEAMDCSAANGHLEIVQWLHANRSEGFTSKAIDGSAGHGHMAVVQWLLQNTSATCTTDATDLAAKYGQLTMVKWLHRNRSEW